MAKGSLYVRVKFAHWSDVQLGICAFDTILYPLVLTVLFSTGWLIGKRRMLNGECYPLIPSLPEELRHVQKERQQFIILSSGVELMLK